MKSTPAAGADAAQCKVLRPQNPGNSATGEGHVTAPQPSGTSGTAAPGTATVTTTTLQIVGNLQPNFRHACSCNQNPPQLRQTATVMHTRPVGVGERIFAEVAQQSSYRILAVFIRAVLIRYEDSRCLKLKDGLSIIE